jgi:hypothetical protein
MNQTALVCRVRQATIKHVNNPVQVISCCSAGLCGICVSQMYLHCDNMRQVDMKFDVHMTVHLY